MMKKAVFISVQIVENLSFMHQMDGSILRRNLAAQFRMCRKN